MKFFLTIYDHKADGGLGYHFRSEPDDFWKTLVTKENTLVRKLEKEAQENRLSVKVNENKLYLIKSKRITSGGRNAVKTVSLKIDFESNYPIWESEFENLISKALDTTSNGGEVRFEIPPSQFPDSIIEYISCQDFNLNGEFSGFSTDEIMSLWSVTPPEIRLNTNLIIGDYKEDELHHGEAGNCWFVSPGEEPNIPFSFTTDKMIIPSSYNKSKALEALRRSVIVADNTGFLGKQWLSVVASEMSRRKFAISNQNNLPIRLELSVSDANHTRRPAWRRSSVETLSSNVGQYAEQFYQLGGLLDSSELSIISQTDRIAAIKPAIDDNNPEIQSFLLDQLVEYLPLFSEDQAIQLLEIMPLDDWSEGDNQQKFEIIMVTLLESNQKVWNYLLSKASVVENYENLTVKQLKELLKQRDLSMSGKKYELIERLSLNEIKSEFLVKYISKTNSVITSNEYLDFLLKLNVFPNPDSLEQYSTETRNCLYLNIDHLFQMNWDNEFLVAETIGRLHARNLNTSGIEISVDQLHHVNSKNNRSLLASYIKGLEAVLNLPENRHKMADVGLIVARFTEINSVWYLQIFEHSSTKEIKQIMIEQKLSLSRLPLSLVLKLYGKEPRLRGWPSWIRKPNLKRTPITVCRLHLEPTLGERLRIFFGYSLLLISLLMILASIGKYFDYVNTEILMALTNDASLPVFVNDYTLMSMISLSAIIIHMRYRKHIKMLRRYEHGKRF